MELTVKSRRLRSLSIVPGVTVGNAPGRSYTSLRAVARSTLRPSGSTRTTVPNLVWALTDPPRRVAAASAKSLASVSTTTSRS